MDVIFDVLLLFAITILTVNIESIKTIGKI